jgi:hypothetical protein
MPKIYFQSVFKVITQVTIKMCKKKCKISPTHTIKEYRRSRITDPLICNVDTKLR